MSVHPAPGRPSESFTSVLSLDIEKSVNPEQVHVLYGLSKDYGAGGMRLGCVISKNKAMVNAIRASWSVPQFLMLYTYTDTRKSILRSERIFHAYCNDDFRGQGLYESSASYKSFNSRCGESKG